jgi:hypothetical protein
MTRFLSILAVIAALFIPIPAFAGAPADGPDKAAEKFYAGYLAVLTPDKDTVSWVAKSKLVTADFKKYYAKQMSPKNEDALDVDPIILAQDVPTKPFKAGEPVIKGNKATVVLTAKFGVDTGKVSVQMVLADGVWLVDSIRAVK